jgi:hypothetical protein
MEAAIAGHDTADREELLVHNWRMERLTGLGVPGPLAAGSHPADVTSSSRSDAMSSDTASIRSRWVNATPLSDTPFSHRLALG